MYISKHCLAILMIAPIFICPAFWVNQSSHSTFEKKPNRYTVYLLTVSQCYWMFNYYVCMHKKQSSYAIFSETFETHVVTSV